MTTNRFKYAWSAGPAAEPVSLADMKLFIRDVDSADDDLVTQQIKVAREQVEGYTGRRLVNQTWVATMDIAPPIMFSLFGGRIDSVTSIKTYDADSSPTTYSSDNYFVDQAGARIALKSGQVWPCPLQVLNGFEVTYVAGYGATASTLPEQLINAVKQLVVHYFEYREPVLVGEMTKVLEVSMIESLEKYRIMRL